MPARLTDGLGRWAQPFLKLLGPFLKNISLKTQVTADAKIPSVLFYDQESKCRIGGAEIEDLVCLGRILYFGISHTT